VQSLGEMPWDGRATAFEPDAPHVLHMRGNVKQIGDLPLHKFVIHMFPTILSMIHMFQKRMRAPDRPPFHPIGCVWDNPAKLTSGAIMFDQHPATVLATAFICLCLPTIVIAQSGSAPGNRERELAQIIREAGYDCSQVDSITNAPEPPPGWESLRPEIATCRNGRRFLVTKSGRSGRNLRPVVRPMPSQSGA
jgi:hypothetical protein